MSLKSLACLSMMACGLAFSATDASAQSWWNPMNVFTRPVYGTPGYGYNSGMNCANGVCTPRVGYGSANCPNGNCGSMQCGPNGCSLSKCGPNGCGVNAYGYGSNFRTPSYMPAYQTSPGFYETHRVPVNRLTNYRAPVSSRGNPFYP